MRCMFGAFLILLLGSPVAFAQSLSVSQGDTTAGQKDQLTVTLSARATSNAIVSLKSSNPAVISLPETLTIPSGSQSVNYNFTCKGVDTTAQVILTAQVLNTSSQAIVYVNPAYLHEMAFSPSEIYGTQACTLYIYLIGPAGPSGDAIYLMSDDFSVSTLDEVVYVPAGSTYTTVRMPTFPVNTTTIVEVMASDSERSNASAILKVRAPYLDQVKASPSTIHAGATAQALCYLNAPAGPSGMNVMVTTDQPSILSVANPAIVANGNSSGYANVIAIGGVDTATTVMLTASLEGVKTTGSLTVTPATLSKLSLSGTSVFGGNGGNAYVFLNGPAGPSGSTVYLRSSDSAVLHLPTSVVVPHGATSFQIPFTTSGVDSATGIKITASTSAGASGFEDELSVMPATVRIVAVTPSYLIGGQAGESVYAYLNGVAGPSGTRVALTSDNPAVVSVPPSILVGPGLDFAKTSAEVSKVPMNIPVSITGRVGTTPSASKNLLVQSAIGSAWPEPFGNTFNTGQGLGYGSKGVEEWSFATAGYVNDPVVRANGDVIISTNGFSTFEGSSQLIELSPSGKALWSYTLSGPKAFSDIALGEDGTIYAALETYNSQGDTGGLMAFTSDGTPKWTYPTGNYVEASPAIAPNGSIVFCCDDGYIYDCNTEGFLNWKYPTGMNKCSFSPCIGSDGTIYVAAVNSGGSSKNASELFVLDSEGKTKWTFVPQYEPLYGCPVIGPNGMVLVGDIEGSIYAFDSTGTVLWERQTDAYNTQLAVANDGTIYQAWAFGVYAVNLDGSTKWHLIISGIVLSKNPTIAADGTVYQCDLGGDVYAISPAGKLLWTRTLPYGNPGTVAIAPDGTLYIGSTSESLYALGK